MKIKEVATARSREVDDDYVLRDGEAMMVEMPFMDSRTA